MFIGNRRIGKNVPVFIIAEAGVNYNNKLKLAYKMVDLAKNAGADAIKFQTFMTDFIQLKSSIKPNYQKKIKEKSYYEIIKSLEPSFDDQVKIFKYCRRKRIIFLSTPYDKKSVDFLDELGVPAFKIASSDLANSFLLKHIAIKRKPIILSTGLSTYADIEKSVRLLKKIRMKNKLILLQTTSNYPTSNNDVNLRVITEFIKRYKTLVGFSDHTTNEIASLGAVAMGACVLEKHFTINRKLPGPDQSSSLEPSELKKWISNIRILEKCLGNSKKVITKSEKKNLSMRKVIVIKSAKKGTIINESLLTAMRGRNGILPLESNINRILGRKLIKTITKPKEFSWKMI